MTRSFHRLVVAPSLFVLAVATVTGSSWARPTRGPFYVPPSPTHQCAKLPYCYGITGPWIVVPAHGEATFLFGCPARAKGKYLLAGTDSLASSSNVRVWWDGELGAPIGQQRVGSTLLFHATTNNGKQGSFQPVLGCINLVQAGKRSTVSARHAAAPRHLSQCSRVPTPHEAPHPPAGLDTIHERELREQGEPCRKLERRRLRYVRPSRAPKTRRREGHDPRGRQHRSCRDPHGPVGAVPDPGPDRRNVPAVTRSSHVV